MKGQIKDNKDNINIILLGNFLYPEGMAATRRKQQFIDYFRERDAEVKVLILYQGSKKRRPVSECDGYYNGVYYRIIGNSMGKSLNVLYRFPAFLFQACKLISRWKIRNARNIILSFGFDGFVIVPFLWSKIIGYRIFFDMVEDFSLYPLNSFRQKIYFHSARLINWLFLNRLVDGISVISKHLERKYKNKFKGPVVIVPVSAEVKRISNKERYSNPLTFVYAGSFSNKDGLEILIAAFDEIHEKYKNTRLLLSGTGDNERLKKISALITGAHVEFTGLLPDMEFYKLLDSADVLLMTRINSGFANAGFPYKLGEYLATGNVVIATTISDIEYYLKDKKDAILIEPEKKDELVKAMNYCIENEKICLEIGKNGQKKCIEYFSPEKNSKTLLELMIHD